MAPQRKAGRKQMVHTEEKESPAVVDQEQPRQEESAAATTAASSSGEMEMPQAVISHGEAVTEDFVTKYANHVKEIMKVNSVNSQQPQILIVCQTMSTATPGDAESKTIIESICSLSNGKAIVLPLFLDIPVGNGGRAVTQHCRAHSMHIRTALEPYREVLLKYVENKACIAIGVWPKRVLVPFLPAFHAVPEVGNPCTWHVAAHLETTYQILSDLFKSGNAELPTTFMPREDFEKLLLTSAQDAGVIRKKRGQRKAQSTATSSALVTTGKKRKARSGDGACDMERIKQRFVDGADTALIAHEMITTEMNLRARIRRAGGEIVKLMVANKKVDRVSTAQVDILTKWRALGFSPVDMALMHPTPLSNIDVSRALDLRDSLQKPTGKVVAPPGSAEWLSTSDIQEILKVSGPERLCACLVSPKENSAVRDEWITFMQKVHSGDAQASECPKSTSSQCKKKLRGAASSHLPTPAIGISDAAQTDQGATSSKPAAKKKTRQNKSTVASTIAAPQEDGDQLIEDLMNMFEKEDESKGSTASI